MAPKKNIIKIHEIDIPLFGLPKLSPLIVCGRHSRPTSQVSTLILKRRQSELVWGEYFPNLLKGVTGLPETNSSPHENGTPSKSCLISIKKGGFDKKLC